MSCLRPSPPTCSSGSNCSKDGCPPGVCPDFTIKRHDTRPPFKVNITEDDGPLDLTGLVLEANMWINTKLKKDVAADDTNLAFADNIGFEQVLVGDIIVMSRVRSPEQMLITGFDEDNKLIQVERGYNGTTAGAYKKGTKMKAFRFMSQPAVTEMLYDNIEQIDGTTLCDQLTDSLLVYEWTANDTCVPGCFWLEFKLLSMLSEIVVPSSTPVCFSGVGVDWVRRFPNCDDGFLIKICDTPTAE